MKVQHLKLSCRFSSGEREWGGRAIRMQDSFGPAVDSLKRAGDTVEARIISSGTMQDRHYRERS
jgi:hypothetical protein